MDLTLTFVQPNIIWEDAAANREAYAQMLADVPSETQLVILPEMCTTGFTMNAEKVAEEMDGPSMTWMMEQAKGLDAVVCGSLGDPGKRQLLQPAYLDAARRNIQSIRQTAHVLHGWGGKSVHARHRNA